MRGAGMIAVGCMSVLLGGIALGYTIHAFADSSLEDALRLRLLGCVTVLTFVAVGLLLREVRQGERGGIATLVFGVGVFFWFLWAFSYVSAYSS